MRVEVNDLVKHLPTGAVRSRYGDEGDLCRRQQAPGPYYSGARWRAPGCDSSLALFTDTLSGFRRKSFKRDRVMAPLSR